jgi:hypothetical protein
MFEMARLVRPFARLAAACTRGCAPLRYTLQCTKTRPLFARAVTTSNAGSPPGPSRRMLVAARSFFGVAVTGLATSATIGTAECAAGGGDGDAAASEADMLSTPPPWTTNPLREAMRSSAGPGEGSTRARGVLLAVTQLVLFFIC